jgi:uncharacterized protein
MSDYDKPSRAEDEYFAKQEVERRKQWAKERAAKMAVDEREQLKQAHWMKCPKCGTDLETVELHGVSIDHCPACGVTVLDKGELDQLMDQERGLFHKVMHIFK